MSLIHVTTFAAPARWATLGRFVELTFTAFASTLRETELWPSDTTIANSEARLPAWTFARFRDDARVGGRDEALAGERSAERVVEVFGLVVEYEDEPSISVERIRSWWGTWQHLAYTTAFHAQPTATKPPGPRWRVLLPFSRPVPRETAIAVGRWARHPRHVVGIVDALSEQPEHAFAVPALIPGGFLSTASDGPQLDPLEAIETLRGWEEADRHDRASVALAGTPLADAVSTLLRRITHPEEHPQFPWPPTPRFTAMATRVGPLRAGDVILFVGDEPVRLALMAAVAVAAAMRGHPAMLASANRPRDELLALCLEVRQLVPSATDVLAGRIAPSEVERACAQLLAEAPRLRLWAPSRDVRTSEALLAEALALSDANEGRSVVIAIDPAEGLDAERPLAEARRSIAAALADVARPEALGPKWPGALVLAGSPGAGIDAVRAATDLERAWVGDPGGLANLVGRQEAELASGADAVVLAAGDLAVIVKGVDPGLVRG